MVYSVDISSFPSQSCSDRSSLVPTLWLTGFEKKRDCENETKRWTEKPRKRWDDMCAHGYISVHMYPDTRPLTHVVGV